MTRMKKIALTALVALALLNGGLTPVASTESQIAGSKGAETFGRESS